MQWMWLTAAIFLEVSGTVCMKLSHGLEKAIYAVPMFVLYALSFACLSLALKKVDVSVAYAIWSGLGTALITAFGILYFKEPGTVIKMISTALIIIGVIGLNLSNGH
jgi:small multidrug resistance pump